MSISTVTSEALQLKLRQLLPSQQGFGTDLSASDTIIPIIDLTAAAEGSDVPENLQTALAFGSQTSFSVFNTTTALVNTTGFYRIFGAISLRAQSGVAALANFSLTDGLSTKVIYQTQNQTLGIDAFVVKNFDFVVFLANGESLTATSNQASTFIEGSTRQIADVNGTLVQPSGFTPQ